MEKRVKNQNFAMLLLLDSKIDDQETKKWLTALINDHWLMINSFAPA